MRMLSRVSILAIATLLVAVAAQPADAACGNLSPIGTRAGSCVTNPELCSFIWTQDVFNPSYAPGYAPFWYAADARPPVTSAFAGIFWKAGTGDPTVGLGDDSGAYDFVASGGFYYYAVPPYGGYNGSYYAGELFVTWSNPAVDGCIGSLACDCVLLTDQNMGTGYFAALGALADTTGATFVNQPGSDGAGNGGPIILTPIPKPGITASVRVPDGGGGFDVDLTVSVPAMTGGVYVKDGCPCMPTGYRVYEQVLDRGAAPPMDRSLMGWAPAQLPGGGDPGVIPVGAATTIRSTCGTIDRDVYLATQLVFDSGFTTDIVSGNATRIECGPNLADPIDVDQKPRPVRDRTPKDQLRPRR